jgi:hypothetical protein
MKNELTNTLFDAMNCSFYRGFALEKLIGGWRIMGKIVTTKEDVDQLIDEALKNLGKSIKQ